MTGAVCAALAGHAALLFARPLPSVTATPTAETKPAAPAASKPAAVTWPPYGQAAVGARHHGVLKTHGRQVPIPTASVAKVMTALAVLDKKPLAPGETGPFITITKQDMAQFDYYFERDGSLVDMREGQRISQYDAMEAMLLPSANNMAFTLARWAFGSIEAYSRYANELAVKHGLEHSHFADASGFSPLTVSTASDLVRLGDVALRHPVIAELSAKRSAHIPVAGAIHNSNGLIGRHGITGVKTGHTDEAGGVFLLSADRKMSDGKTETIITAVMGAEYLDKAMIDSVPLLNSAIPNIIRQTPVSLGQVFGNYATPWNDRTVNAVAGRSANLLTWRGTSVTTKAELKPITGNLEKGATVGSVTISAGSQTTSVPLVLDEAIDAPPARWRILR